MTSRRLALRAFAALLPTSLMLATMLHGSPAFAQTAPDDVSADLQMMQAAQPYRRAADTFAAKAMAGDTQATLGMLSRVLVGRTGEAAVRRVLDAQICRSSCAATRSGAA